MRGRTQIISIAIHLIVFGILFSISQGRSKRRATAVAVVGSEKKKAEPKKEPPNRTIPITGAGDPNQGRASYTAGLSYYHRGHNLKLQLNYSYNQELDDKTPDGRSARYHNDKLILQLTYRLE